VGGGLKISSVRVSQQSYVTFITAGPGRGLKAVNNYRA
jgi:hypothetical protein